MIYCIYIYTCFTYTYIYIYIQYVHISQRVTQVMDEGWQPLQLPPEIFDDETSHQLIFDVNIPEIRVFGL